MEEKKSMGKLWRLTKVFYFLITLPILGIGSITILLDQTIYRGNSYASYINDYYLGTLFLIGFLLGYIIITDLIRRIISYINRGDFKGFVPYLIIIKKYIIIIIILGGIVGGSLFSLSEKLRNECTGNNEGFNDYGVCICNNGYLRENNICNPTLETKVLNMLPSDSFLRELKVLPGNLNKYIGIYIKNYTIDTELNVNNYCNSKNNQAACEQPYGTCADYLHGQGISGEYHVFLTQLGDFRDTVTSNGKKYYLNNDIKLIDDIVLYNDGIATPGGYLSLSYYNTKENNNLYFSGSKINDNNKYDIELTNLINFNDYNGDGIKNEFLLKQRGGACGLDLVSVIGIDNKLYHIINYDIVGKNDNYKWRDNFYPKNNGEVINGWECGNHGAETEEKNYYKFNKLNNNFELIKSETKNCNFNYKNNYPSAE